MRRYWNNNGRVLSKLSVHDHEAIRLGNEAPSISVGRFRFSGELWADVSQPPRTTHAHRISELGRFFQVGNIVLRSFIFMQNNRCFSKQVARPRINYLQRV